MPSVYSVYCAVPSAASNNSRGYTGGPSVEGSPSHPGGDTRRLALGGRYFGRPLRTKRKGLALPGGWVIEGPEGMRRIWQPRAVSDEEICGDL